jgi:hypothetical protein
MHSVSLVLSLLLEIVFYESSKGVVAVLFDLTADNADYLSDFVRSDETSTVTFFARFSTFV